MYVWGGCFLPWNAQFLFHQFLAHNKEGPTENENIFYTKISPFFSNIGIMVTITFPTQQFNLHNQPIKHDEKYFNHTWKLTLYVLNFSEGT